MIFPQTQNDRKVRTFSLSLNFVEEYQGRQPEWGPLGYFTYKRTYARPTEGGRTEEWDETCKRVVEGVYNLQKIHCRTYLLPWNEPKAQKSAQEMFRRMWDFKWLPPGRGLWMMGTDLVYEKGSAALNNCAFASTQAIDVDFAAPFCFLMDMSMLGVGVGGDTRGKGKVRIQTPRYTDETYVVGDSREGWVDLIHTVLNSFVGRGSYPTNIDYSEVRPRGTPINGFGGVASGSQPMIDLVENLTNLLTPKDGKSSKISSAQIVDIFNYIGKCVVAGGIRRTAEIMFGEPDDEEFITLKQDKEALMDRRWASNNSVFGTVGMDYTEIAKSIAVNGEPGIIWLDNMRRFSRMGKPADNKDMRVMGSNPCSEQSLESFELCCLVETFPANHTSFEDYKRTLKFAYLYAKTVTLVPTHDVRTNAVTQRNRRIGCSQSGIIQAMNKLGRREYLRWCDNGYDYIKDLDTLYSEWLCVGLSKKMTSVKPSGTVSLLTGSTPGIHYPHSEHYIRRIRVQNTSPLVAACEKAGYEVEADAYSDDTSVVSFPVREEHFVQGKDDVTMWQQFANAVDLQRHWADNQVSITVTFRQDEVKDIKPCLEIYEADLKSISMLPLNDHGYVQAPYETITGDQYWQMMDKISPLNLASTETHDVSAEDKFCDGGTCTLSL